MSKKEKKKEKKRVGLPKIDATVFRTTHYPLSIGDREGGEDAVLFVFVSSVSF